jgi:fructoselysine-6-P-deglycase FrlB-like protein
MTKKINNLNQTVIETLNFFLKNPAKKISFHKSKLSLAVGSVNAKNTAKMLLANQATIYADESNLKSILKTHQPLIKQKIIDQAVIISASGEKDAVWEIKALKKLGLKTTLLTCNPEASTIKLADNFHIFPKISEPYSYNFSTYLSMLLSFYQENPSQIKKFLENLKIPKNFKSFKYFSFILDDKYRAIAEMIKVKDDEMFAAKSSLRAFSFGQARHAKFIYQNKNEMVISFGKNQYFGHPKNRWEIDLSKNHNYAFTLSLAYYLVGLIQEQKPDYFKRSLKDYCLNRGPKPYKANNQFKVIVPGDN